MNNDDRIVISDSEEEAGDEVDSDIEVMPFTKDFALKEKASAQLAVIPDSGSSDEEGWNDVHTGKKPNNEALASGGKSSKKAKSDDEAADPEPDDSSPFSKKNKDNSSASLSLGPASATNDLASGESSKKRKSEDEKKKRRIVPSVTQQVAVPEKQQDPDENEQTSDITADAGKKRRTGVTNQDRAGYWTALVGPKMTADLAKFAGGISLPTLVKKATVNGDKIVNPIVASVALNMLAHLDQPSRNTWLYLDEFLANHPGVTEEVKQIIKHAVLTEPSSPVESKKGKKPRAVKEVANLAVSARDDFMSKLNLIKADDGEVDDGEQEDFTDPNQVDINDDADEDEDEDEDEYDDGIDGVEDLTYEQIQEIRKEDDEEVDADLKVYRADQERAMALERIKRNNKDLIDYQNRAGSSSGN